MSHETAAVYREFLVRVPVVAFVALLFCSSSNDFYFRSELGAR